MSGVCIKLDKLIVCFYCRWFYEGRNGWWQYDERTSADLEAHYMTDAQSCELLIAGFLYTVDFTSMLQVNILIIIDNK